MSFRRGKERGRERREAWAEWIARYRPELQAIGLPPEVSLSAAHWEDFLENGYLEWHPQDFTGFTFDSLTPAAAGALRRSLERQYGGTDRSPSLLEWLRVRHRDGGIA